MNTTNIQTLAKYDDAAQDICELLEQLGFTTEFPVNGDELKRDIALIIMQNIDGKYE